MNTAALAANDAPVSDTRPRPDHRAGKGAIFLFIALLIAAIIWNLGTWWLGLPGSSSQIF